MTADMRHLIDLANQAQQPQETPATVEVQTGNPISDFNRWAPPAPPVEDKK
jgi:hypothetical protein